MQADFVAVQGLREQAKFKYGATDIYIGCILAAKQGENDQVIDV